MAKDILRNNYVVGDYTIVKDHELLKKSPKKSDLM